jgi:hypothetical protein
MLNENTPEKKMDLGTRELIQEFLQGLNDEELERLGLYLEEFKRIEATYLNEETSLAPLESEASRQQEDQSKQA